MTGDERLMILTIAKLTQVLIQQLRVEIHGSSNEQSSAPDRTVLDLTVSLYGPGHLESVTL